MSVASAHRMELYALKHLTLSLPYPHPYPYPYHYPYPTSVASAHRMELYASNDVHMTTWLGLGAGVS